MTDEELIAYLRLQGLDKDIAAADRIELLATTNDVAALVEALENVIGEYDLFRKYEYERGLAPLDDEIHEARATLAEIKGESHE